CSHPSIGSGGAAAGTLRVSVASSAPLGGRATAVVSPSGRDRVSANNHAATALGVQAPTPPAAKQ
ncbi:MAG: hypothetical protein ABIP94_01390, partial [Planctomycetota bacterium]